MIIYRIPKNNTCHSTMMKIVLLTVKSFLIWSLYNPAAAFEWCNRVLTPITSKSKILEAPCNSRRCLYVVHEIFKLCVQGKCTWNFVILQTEFGDPTTYPDASEYKLQELCWRSVHQNTMIPVTGPCVSKICIKMWRQSISFIAKQVRLIIFVLHSKLIQEWIRFI